MSGPGNPTTSSTSVYNPTAEQIITDALVICGIINDEEQPQAPMFKTGMRALNSMMKELEATGIHVWTEEEGILFLQQNQISYKLGGPPGNPSPDHATKLDAYVLLTLAASVSTGDSSVIVQSATGVLDGDYIGIVLDAGNVFWTTVDGAPVSNTITLASPITGAAAGGQLGFTYTTPLVRPLRIPYSRRIQYPMGAQQGNIITPLVSMMSRQEYFDLPQPLNPGIVNQAFYDPARDQGLYYVWNAPANGNFGITFTGYRPLLDFTSTDDTADLPQEWNNALIWNLARELALRYSVPAQRVQTINAEAAAKLDLVRDWDREPQSVYFGRSAPQSRGR